MCQILYWQHLADTIMACAASFVALASTLKNLSYVLSVWSSAGELQEDGGARVGERERERDVPAATTAERVRGEPSQPVGATQMDSNEEGEAGHELFSTGATDYYLEDDESEAGGLTTDSAHGGETDHSTRRR